MIKLTQLNGDVFVVNAELIAYLHAKHHTVLTLTHGDKVAVKESLDKVIERIIEYKRTIYRDITKKEAR